MAKKEKSMKKQETNKNKKSFFKDFKAELKRVNWPTPKQLVNNTIAVITIVLITAVIVFILDFAFEALNRNGINKLKEVITTENSVSNETTENTENTENTEATDENVSTEESNQTTDSQEEVNDVTQDNSTNVAE